MGRSCWVGQSVANHTCRDQLRLDPTRVNELRRSVQLLLNKVCPESIDALVPQFANIQINDGCDLGFVTRLILQRAQLDPHYIETYADSIIRLNGIWQEGLVLTDEAATPVTFQAMVHNICWETYEALPSSFEPTAEEHAVNDPADLEFCK